METPMQKMQFKRGGQGSSTSSFTFIEGLRIYFIIQMFVKGYSI